MRTKGVASTDVKRSATRTPRLNPCAAKPVNKFRKRRESAIVNAVGSLGRRGWEDEESDGTSNGSLESEPRVGGSVQRREASIQKRSKIRLRRLLESAEDCLSGGQMFLESRAVGPLSQKSYKIAVSLWKAHITRVGLPTGDDEEIDAAVSDYFDHCFFLGLQPSAGERLLAGLMHYEPRFGRLGSSRLPRSWRSLKGWRRMVPPRSRKPLPWPVWAAIAWQLREAGRKDMAVFVLTSVTGYFRPGELFRVKRGDLVPPAGMVLGCWAVLLAPEEDKVPTKTNIFNDSVALDSTLVKWLEKEYEQIHIAGSRDAAWEFSYAQFVNQFVEATTRLRLPRVVPYQMRHSGPSIDLALGLRTLEAAQKRGRWAMSSTVARYERHARLSREWSLLTLPQQKLFTKCAKHLEAIVGGAKGLCDLQELDPGPKGSTLPSSSQAHRR